MVNTEALEEILSNIRVTQESFQLDQTVEIVAVTKTHPFSAIQEVYNKGVVSIGENRVQEAVLKFRSFEKMPKMTKRFIGHLQTNKVKKCVELFDTIDSVDSLRLIKKISNQALKSNKIPTHLYVAPREPHGWRELHHELFKVNIELDWFEKHALNKDYKWELAPKTKDKKD